MTEHLVRLASPGDAAVVHSIYVEAHGQVRGYAYAGAYRTRAAYRWAAEVSVYVAAQHHRGGLGRILYRSLIRLLEAQGF